MHLLLLFWLTLAAILTGQVPPSSAIQVFVNDPLKWERGDRPGQPAPRMASGQILVLKPDGALAIVYCYLYRTPDGQMHILYQEGYSVASGKWRTTAGTISAQYKIIYANVPSRTQEPTMIEEVWKYAPANAAGHLARRIKARVDFVPLTNLADESKLLQVIESHRRRSAP